jgi:hypothetical protein
VKRAVAGSSAATEADVQLQRLRASLRRLDPTQIQEIVGQKESRLRRLLRLKRSRMRAELTEKATALGVQLPPSFYDDRDPDEDDGEAGGGADGVGAAGDGDGEPGAGRHSGAGGDRGDGSGSDTDGGEDDDDDDDASFFANPAALARWSDEGDAPGLPNVPLFTGFVSLPPAIVALSESVGKATGDLVQPAAAPAAAGAAAQSCGDGKAAVGSATATATPAAPGGQRSSHASRRATSNGTARLRGSSSVSGALGSQSTTALIDASGKDRMVGGARAGKDKLKARSYNALIAFLEAWKKPLGQLPSRAVNDICTAVSAIDLVSNWTARLQEVADNSSAQAVGRILVHYSRKAMATWRSDLGALCETFPLEGMVTLTYVAPGRAAAAAGLRINDVVWACDGDRVRSKEELLHALAARKPGQIITLTLINDAQSVIEAAPSGDESIFIHRRAQFRVLRERIDVNQVRKVRVRLGAQGLGSAVVAKLRSLANGVVYYRDVRRYNRSYAHKKRWFSEGNDDDEAGGGAAGGRGTASEPPDVASPAAIRFRRALQRQQQVQGGAKGSAAAPAVGTPKQSTRGSVGGSGAAAAPSARATLAAAAAQQPAHYGSSANPSLSVGALALQAQEHHSAATNALIPTVFRVRAQAVMSRQLVAGATAALAESADGAIAAGAGTALDAAENEEDAARFDIKPPKVPIELRCVETGVRYVYDCLSFSLTTFP